MAELPDLSSRDPEDLARVFRYFGEVETPRLDSAVYTVYSLGVAEDPELLALAGLASPEQPPPNVLYAAVQDLLLEIGPSAGLNLRLDRYRYDYGAGHVWGDPETVRWLRALIWPEHVARAQAMEAALDHARNVPIEIVEGDATLDIEAQVRALPEDVARVVFATHVFYQIPDAGRKAILEGLARASVEAPVDLILMESTGKGDSALTHFAFEAGARAGQHDLARSDSHGRWIDWREA